MFLQIEILQVTEHEMPKKRNLRYLTETVGQNG